MAKNDTLDNDTKPTSDASLNPGDRFYRKELIGGNKEYKDAHGDTVQRNYNADKEDSRKALEEKENDGDSFYKRYSGSKDNPPQKNRISTGRLIGKLSPSGGIVSLLLFAIIGVGGGTTILSSSLLINIKEIFHNDRADATRTHLFFSKAMISKSIGYKGAGCGTVAIKCRMGTISDKERLRYERAGFKIKGELVSTNGKVAGKYESPEKYNSNNNDSDKNSRYIAKEITFPDGKTVNTGDGFFKYASANTKMKVKSLAVFNPRSAFFLNERFNGMLNKTFKFSKGKILTGTKKEDIDKSFNEKTNGITEKDTKSGAKKSKLEEDSKKVSDGAKSKLGGNVAGISTEVLTAACSAYNAARFAVTGYKMIRMYQLISFALPWLQAADQIKDQGKISPEIVDNLSSRLTYFESNEKLKTNVTYNSKLYSAGSKNPKFNLTATDSQGYKIAAHGDKSALKDFAKVWLLGGNKDGAVAKISSQLDSLTSLNGLVDKKTSKTLIRATCKALSSPTALIAGAVVTILDCLSTFLGNVATGPQGCIVPIIWIGAGVAIQAITQVVANEMIKYAADEAQSFVIGSDLNGVDAGDAIAAGVGLMLGSASVGAGLRPSKSVKETQDYIVYTENANKEQIAAERFIARSDPFNVYNRHSFFGSIVRKLQSPMPISGTLYGSISNIYSLVSSNLSSGGVASAIYNQPSLIQKERFDCEDPDLVDIGVIGDKFCNIATIMPTDDLRAAEQQTNGTRETIDEVIDYMINPQDQPEDKGGTLDDSFGAEGTVSGAAIDVTKVGAIAGTPRSTLPSIDLNGKPTPGSQYALYLKYCTDTRVTEESQTTWTGETGAGSYWGTTTKEIEKDSNRDQDWYSGKQCTDPIKSKMMSMFRQYTNYCLQKATMQGTMTCWEDTPTVSPSGSVTTVGGEWSYPSTCETSVSDRFGTRGGTHMGLDIAGPFGTPIYAARDGKVIQSGPASGFGNWIVIQHEVDGKRVDTVYGHMKASDLLVKTGDTVKSGQLISKIASEGGSTGPHLHFEIWQGGRFGGNAIDPEQIINRYRVCV